MTQQSKQTEEFEIKPWYKQVWPWAIISVPILTVFAGVATYFIAANQPHSMVKDNYFKEGLAINQSIEKQNRAKAMNLVAVLELDKSADLLTVKLSSSDKLPNKIEVLFSHPTQSKSDKLVKLEAISESEFVGQLPQLKPAYWYVILNDTDSTWLLKSRWHVQDSNTHTIKAGEQK